MMGNNNSNYVGRRSEKTNKSDFYETHYSLTEQFLDQEIFDKDGSFLEPASGKGAIVKVLEKRFDNIIYYDKYLDANNYGDFLLEQRNFDYIIMNPPYSNNLPLKFILKSKQICNKKFAMFLKLNYLHGKLRYDKIYNDLDLNFPMTKIYIFTRYPMLGTEIRDDGKYRTGMTVYMWAVWEKQEIYYDINHCSNIIYDGHPKVYWIDNNNFVLKSK